MKKRIISLTLAAMMLAVTLIGCGNSTNENVTPENTEVTTETPTPDTTTPEVDVPETEVGDNDVDVETFFSTSYALDFPEGMTGFTDKYVFSSDETWSLNNTHYVDNSGNTMNFEWEGPAELGESAGTNGNTLSLLGGNYTLWCWYPGEMGLTNMDELNELLEVDKETWYSLATITPITDGYYDIERVDNMVYVTYAVKENGMTGYARFLANGETNNYYRFVYLENDTVYDDARAMKVVESIKYWDYEPTNE